MHVDKVNGKLMATGGYKKGEGLKHENCSWISCMIYGVDSE